MEIARYYELQQEGLGERFLDQVDATIRKIEAHPKIYRAFSSPYRQCLMKPFPYGIIFRIDHEMISIASIMHLHRYPDAWKQELGLS